MRKRVRINDKNKIPEVVRKMEELDGSLVRVGVLEEGKIKMIAVVQEFGISIGVTDKMRRYLATQGLYLKKSTQHIRIPERSFIRAGWDENEKEILDKVESLVLEAIEKGISVDAVLDGTGQETQGRIRDYARDLKDPENHPFTVEQKGSSNPLVDSGNLIQNITYEIKK
jgi:hypothetical protein